MYILWARSWGAAVVVVVLVATATLGCGTNDPVLVDACVELPVTLTIEQPTTFACHQKYTVKLRVNNGSCAPITIQSIALAGSVNSGACAPPAPGSYPPAITTVAAGQSATILDLTTGAFCCTSPGCPASFSCDERYDVTVGTSTGNLGAYADTHLDLDGCTEICP